VSDLHIAHGPTPFAFTFKNAFPADEQFVIAEA
jgi:hypothetical protein